VKLGQKVFFYEGDYVDKSRKRYVDYYKGMASSNFMLIAGPEQLLIDSGCPVGPHWKRIENELLADGNDLNRTTHVIFSHGHPDHVIMAKELCKKRPIRFSIHKDNERILRNRHFFFETIFNFPEDVRNEILVFPAWIVKAYLGLLGMDFGYLKAQRFFSDGEVVNEDPKIVVVEMPAHSPGHAGFYFPDEKIFYSADLFDLRCIDGADVIVGSSSYARALGDLERVKSLDIDILVPGHGMLIVGKDRIKETLDKITEATRRYLNDVLACLPTDKAAAICITDLQPKAFPGAISYNAFSRRILTYNLLEYLQNEGRVGCVYRRNAHRRRAYWYAVQAGA
jgi:glyoxylase-like metal-dependent hydrolase (beta-lactamase superfamily II)